MINSTYGLDTLGVVDNDWFWQEVWLRAVNNYGPWNNKSQARARIIQSIYDVCGDAEWKTNQITFLISESKIQIKLFVEDMTADYNGYNK